MYLTNRTIVITWLSILVAYIRFRAALAAQGVNRDTDLVFKSRFQPYTAYFALAFFSIILLFNGFAVFTYSDGVSNFSAQDFVTAYVGIPIYIGFYLFWKLLKRTKFVKASEADIWTGKEPTAHIWTWRSAIGAEKGYGNGRCRRWKPKRNGGRCGMCWMS